MVGGNIALWVVGGCRGEGVTVLMFGWGMCVCGEMVSSFQHLRQECTISTGPTSEL